MAKNCLGGVSFDELKWKPGQGQDTDFTIGPGIALCDTMTPGPVTSGNRGSKYGGSFQPITEHENRSDAFITRTLDFISYYAWDNFSSYNVTAAGDQSYLTSHFDGDGAPNGAVRIVWAMALGPPAVYIPEWQYKSGGTWTTRGQATNSIPITYSSQDCWALQVDMTNGDAGKCEARVMHYDEEGACPNGAELGAGNGTWHEEIAWTAVLNNGDILNAGVLATPSLGFKQVSGKGTSHLTRIESSYWVYEADSAANLPSYEDGSNYDYEVWASYLNADSGATNWAATGGGCSGLWRVLCDPEEPDATTNGYISVTGNGSAEAYMGEVADIGAANGNQMQTLDGVGLVAIIDTDAGGGNNYVDDVGLSYNGTTSWKTGTRGLMAAEDTIFAFWDKNPEGDAWVVGDLAGLTAGVRSDAGNDGRCYGLVVCLVGSGGRRPTNDLDACPAAGRRIFIHTT